MEEILGYLDGKEKVVLVGCGGCATVFHTGGEPEVKEMADTLSEHGKSVLAAIAPPFGEFTCYAPWSKIEGEFSLVKPIYPANDPIGHMGGGPALFKEKCQQCGECLLGRFAGICPLTNAMRQWNIRNYLAYRYIGTDSNQIITNS